MMWHALYLTCGHGGRVRRLSAVGSFQRTRLLYNPHRYSLRFDQSYLPATDRRATRLYPLCTDYVPLTSFLLSSLVLSGLNNPSFSALFSIYAHRPPFYRELDRRVSYPVHIATLRHARGTRLYVYPISALPNTISRRFLLVNTARRSAGHFV